MTAPMVNQAAPCEKDSLMNTVADDGQQRPETILEVSSHLLKEHSTHAVQECAEGHRYLG